MLRQLLSAIALTALAAASIAQRATSTYTGNNFDTFVGTTWDSSDAVSLTITLDPSPVSVTNQILVPTDYTFSDGVNTFTLSSANGGIQARITTDAADQKC